MGKLCKQPWIVTFAGTAIFLCALTLSPTPAAAQGYDPGGANITAGTAEESSSPAPGLPSGLIDLNTATLEEIRTLPIEEDTAWYIWEHRTYIKYFTSVYELLDIEGIDRETFEKLRPLVRIFPPIETDSELERMRRIYYKIQGWLSSEGTNEAIVDQWLDLARVPLNVNKASWKDLANLQNVSPIDAVAVDTYISQFGRVSSQRSLRTISGLSNWGYRNLRTFVEYEDPAGKRRLAGDFQLRIYNTPYFSDFEEMMRSEAPDTTGTAPWWGRLSMDNAPPAVTMKLRSRYGPDLKAGIITHRNLGEESLTGNLKGYAGFERKDIGPFKNTTMYFGNYLVTLGQGLVMENTDFFKPRKSGYGFDKRYIGIVGDFSRSEQFKLTGAALETSFGPLQGIFFASKEKRDAVMGDHVTSDGDTIQVVKTLITMTPRPEDEDFEDQGLISMRDALGEITLGGNIRFNFLPGTYLGVSGYESQYDHYFYPDSITQDDPTILLTDKLDKIKSADNEFLSLYSGAHDDSLRAKYRRVIGAEFQTVIKNLVFQAEYAKLIHGGDAWVANTFVQFDNLNFFALYRDYDVDFDNPYSRAFSNYQRYKGTILEDEYYLSDPIYGYLYDNSAQSQAEKGFYLKSRYKFIKDITANLEYDNWVRQADGSPHCRFVTTISYRPIYPMIISMRHKYQARNDNNDLTVDAYINNEDRLKVTALLSKYDRIAIEYTSSSTRWPPRGRLSGNEEADGGSPLQGSFAEPGHAINFLVEHNVSDRLELKASCLVYDGFVWIFEDTEFMVLDGRSVRWWVSAWDRVSERLSVYMKLTMDQNADMSGLDMRKYNEEVGGYVDADNVKDYYFGFRFQLDFAW